MDEIRHNYPKLNVSPGQTITFTIGTPPVPADWVVELEHGVWISDVSGDPGRTVVFQNAKHFETQRDAEIALRKARRYRRFANAVICLTEARAT